MFQTAGLYQGCTVVRRDFYTAYSQAVLVMFIASRGGVVLCHIHCPLTIHLVTGHAVVIHCTIILINIHYQTVGWSWIHRSYLSNQATPSYETN